MTLFWPAMQIFNDVLALKGVLREPCLVSDLPQQRHPLAGFQFHREFFHGEILNALRARKVGRFDRTPMLPEYATVFDLSGLEMSDLADRSQTYWPRVRLGGSLVVVAVAGGRGFEPGAAIAPEHILSAMSENGVSLIYKAFHDERYDKCELSDSREAVLAWFVGRRTMGIET